MKNIVEISKAFAIKSHNSVNQKYDGKSYDFHLQMSVDFAMMFIHLIPEEDRDYVISGLWSHDILEDISSVTYNDLMKKTNKSVAEIAYALTNEKGRNRKSRANAKYYRGIRNTKYATFGKLCDRLANTKHSIDSGSRMIKVYIKEYDNFKNSLTDIFIIKLWKKITFYKEPNYDEMWKHLDKMLNKKNIDMKIMMNSVLTGGK